MIRPNLSPNPGTNQDPYPINDERIYNFPYNRNEKPEDSLFLTEVKGDPDTAETGKTLEEKLGVYRSPIKSSQIDIAVVVKEILGVNEYKNATPGLDENGEFDFSHMAPKFEISRKVIANAVKESIDDKGRVDCKKVFEQLMVRRRINL